MIEFDMPLSMHILNQLWLSIALLLPMILVARTFVAGSRYSPILIIVIFGLLMGFVLVKTGASSPGLPEFLLIDLMSKTTIIALIASFFVGGQELKKLFFSKDQEFEPDNSLIPAEEEVLQGTNRTQLIFIVRAFFLLLGIEGVYRTLVQSQNSLTEVYPLLGYIGLVIAVILIDHKAQIKNKRLYINKGFVEIAACLALMVVSYWLALAVQPIIALPQIFYAMMLAAALGAGLSHWQAGPTLRALLFAGIPVVLAANFMIGGSRIMEALAIEGVSSVLFYGFFGQLTWMFGGIALMMYFGKTKEVRNLAPGMAGGLSHSGLTGACTAGDLGKVAANRAPIMINVPFFGHVFVFSILAMSAAQGSLLVLPSLLIMLAGIGLTIISLRTLAKSNGRESQEVKGLMQFSFGWQLTAMFGGMMTLAFFAMRLDYSAMAVSSALSHFGLFAAVQEGLFGAEAASMIPFIFSMPFLVHPFVFYLFGRAMSNNEQMPAKPVYILAAIGVIGSFSALIFI